MSQYENDRSSAATLVCDYSVNDLNQLLLQSHEANEVSEPPSMNSSPGKVSGTDRYNQLTRLEENEENVDFMEMYTQYHQSPEGKMNDQMILQQQYQQQQQQQEQLQQDQYMNQNAQERNEAQVQYYQQQMQNESYSERLNESYQNNQQLAFNQGPGGIPRPNGKKTRSMRPGSATVSGNVQGRFLNQQSGSRKRNAQNGSTNQLDHYSYSFQQPGPQMNNLMAGSSTGGSHRPTQFQQIQKPPMIRKKTRPASAAKNQMNPARELQSVTNFTYQKAKQNLNQRAYVPDSLKNTDKERLYEEKINLKKMLNEQMKQNQQLKTQLQSQQGLIKKKDDMVQQVMKQMFHPSKQSDSNLDTFLQDFQKREILHNNPISQPISTTSKRITASKSLKNSNVMVNKESQITSLRLKMKETYDILQVKEKELFDLKQTLKFTKIKEYETELSLNVQESQRLRILLEREIQKPKIDPRFVQGLKLQIAQYQQMIQNLQQNLNFQQENSEKQEKKLQQFAKKFAKQKESRKRLIEKNQRLEKKVAILQSRANVPQASQGMPKRGSKQQNVAGLHEQEQEWNKRFNDQNMLIEKLIIKMQECGVEINEDEIISMQIGEEDVQNQQDQFQQQEMAEAPTWDMIVSFGGARGDDGIKNQTHTKEINGAQFQNYEDLVAQMRQHFAIDNDDQIKIKYVNEVGELHELNQNTWDHCKELSITNQIQLGIELIQAVIEEEESNYEEDNDFEEVISETVYKDPVELKDVQRLFKELRLILQIKAIKKGDVLKYILHGVRDSETNKKRKVISVKTLSEQIQDKIGFDDTASLKIARFLIEKPNDEGKIEQKGSEANHYEKTTIVRKQLSEKLLNHIQDYVLYNGMALTSLLTRIQGMFEEQRIELEEELVDRDYEDAGTASMEEIFETMGLIGLQPKSFDQEVTDFIEFMAMRHAKSLSEVPYKDLVKCFDEDYNLIEDKKSIWEHKDAPYEPSSDEGELESEKSVQQQVENHPEGNEEQEQNDDTEDLEQNVLLEKVDEILMQIVQKLPQQNKIRTLTQYMMPFLSNVYDEDMGRQYLIINQNAFIQFLLGQGSNQLGLQLEESHIICLLHLLVQEDEKEEEQDSQNKYILYDEFIELVKTYMKKELIMNQSKGLGIYYDILSKQSVEFLFQIRSSLMHDTNLNENSGDGEEEIYNNSSKKQKSVPKQIREIFGSIIERKNIQLKNQGKDNNSRIEVMDFDMMLDVLYMKLGINCPSAKSQEELKYLMCLDFKYLEMVMLVKFDKVMHDLDYISIDLLRQAQDPSMNQKRIQSLEYLKQQRDQQLSNLKKVQESNSYQVKSQPIVQNDIYAVGQESYQVGGVSQSSKQEKKRKRPDDKKQTLSKKFGQFPSNKESQNIEQDQYGQSSGASPSGKERYAGNNQNGPKRNQDNFGDIDVDLDVDINNSDKMKRAKNEEVYDEPSEDYLQDDIPIDDDDDEDGIISDNYDNFDKTGPKSNQVPSPPLSHKKETRNDTKTAPMDDHIISMEHSDDLEQSHKPEFALPVDKSSHHSDEEDEIEDEEEAGVEDNYDVGDDSDDMEGMEGMDPEELEQAMLVAGLMQDMAGDDEEEDEDNYSSEKGESVQERLAESMPDDNYEDMEASNNQSSPQQAFANPIKSERKSLKESSKSLAQSKKSESKESGIDNYSVDDIEEDQLQQSDHSKGKDKSVKRSSGSRYTSEQSNKNKIPKAPSSHISSRRSLKSSIKSFKNIDEKSIHSIKSSVVKSKQETPIASESEKYQDEFSHHSSKKSSTLLQKEQMRYSKKSSHSSRKQSHQSGTASQKMSQRVSEKASQRYRVSDDPPSSMMVRNPTEEQDIMQRNSSEKVVDKQERSPDQMHDEYDVDDFEVGVPSAKQSEKSKKVVQDEISENYDEFGSSYRSSTQKTKDNFGKSGKQDSNLEGSKTGIDLRKDSVQQIEEDNYIQDNSGSDDYEDDIVDSMDKSGTQSAIKTNQQTATKSDIQQDQALSSASKLQPPAQNNLTKTDSKNQLNLIAKQEIKESEGSEDDYEF